MVSSHPALRLKIRRSYINKELTLSLFAKLKIVKDKGNEESNCLKQREGGGGGEGEKRGVSPS